MKKDIHPEYREVLFHDTSVDEYFIINSTLNTSQTKSHLLLILSIPANKKLSTLVVEYKNLKKDLVKNNTSS